MARRKRPKKPRLPRSLEGVYLRETRRIWKAAQAIIAEGLEPLLEVWPDETTTDSRLDGPISIKMIQRRMITIERQLGRMLGAAPLKRLLDRLAARVVKFTDRELDRVAAIDLRASDKQVARYIGVWREHNIQLIESGVMAHEAATHIRPSLLDDMSRTIEAAHRGGVPVRVLRKQIMERFRVSNSRADLIARDQILKLNGQITKQRQTGAGITHYRWSTSRDERVRDEHRALEGTLQAWASPPSVGHPGEDYQCRCVSIPVMPEG